MLKTRQKTQSQEENQSVSEGKVSRPLRGTAKRSVKSKRKSKQPDKTKEAELSLKERLAQKRKAEKIRKELFTFTLVAVFFSAIVGFVVGFAFGVKPGIGASVGIACVALSFKYPRHALWAFLIYLPFGGTITYSIGNSPLLQLAKDGFYIPALLGVIQYCRRENLPILIPRPLIPPVAILLTFCLMVLTFVNGAQQLAPDPNGQPIVMGILGLKVLMGYIPLIVCAYYLIRDRKDLLFLMRLMVVLILICCGLAFVQYLFLKTGRCAGTRFGEGSELFAASLQARCLVGGSLLYSPQHNQIRLPGTFVAPWQWGWFLISSSFIAFAPAFNDPVIRWRTLSLASLALVAVMSVLSGQRIALALVPLVFVLLLVITGQVIQLKRFLPTAIGLGVILSVAALRNPQVLQDRIASLQGRWNASPPQQFIMEQFRWASGGDGILGHGLGRATNSARALGSVQLIEAYYPKLLYEIGPIGMLSFLLVVTVLTFLAFQAYRSVRDRTLRNYGASLAVFVLFISYNTYYYPLDVDPVAVYFWFFAGVILKLPEIERREKLEAVNKELPPEKKRRRVRQKGFA